MEETHPLRQAGRCTAHSTSAYKAEVPTAKYRAYRASKRCNVCVHKVEEALVSLSLKAGNVLHVGSERPRHQQCPNIRRRADDRHSSPSTSCTRAANTGLQQGSMKRWQLGGVGKYIPTLTATSRTIGETCTSRRIAGNGSGEQRKTVKWMNRGPQRYGGGTYRWCGRAMDWYGTYLPRYVPLKVLWSPVQKYHHSLRRNGASDRRPSKRWLR